MANYINADITKTGLIMAAGELFAEHGIDAVSVRDIAGKAGVNIGLIHYHFGGKDGLIEAVMDFACEFWKNDPLGGYLDANRHLLIAAEGQTRVICEMVGMFLDLLYNSHKPDWCCTLLFQIIQRDLEISRKVYAVTGQPVLGAFIRFYRLVTGDDDLDKAYFWSSPFIDPAVLHAINPCVICRVHQKEVAAESFLPKLRAFCLSQARNSIGLLSAAKK